MRLRLPGATASRLSARPIPVRSSWRRCFWQTGRARDFTAVTCESSRSFNLCRHGRTITVVHQLTIFGALTEKANIPRAEQVLAEQLARLREVPPTAVELARVKNRLRQAFAFSSKATWYGRRGSASTSCFTVMRGGWRANSSDTDELTARAGPAPAHELCRPGVARFSLRSSSRLRSKRARRAGWPRPRAQTTRSRRLRGRLLASLSPSSSIERSRAVFDTGRGTAPPSASYHPTAGSR